MLIVDLFAGGGGASWGMRTALGRDPDIAINHDPEAVAMHMANHPGTYHFCQDIWKVHPLEATKGRPVDLLWASPDCTHFSKAKGGKPRKQNIRDLAWVVVEWARAARPRVIILENVEEFRTWGPLDTNNLPDKTRRGETFAKWVARLERHGYRVEWRELRACDYGAPTIRKRLFLIARRDGLPIIWPEPTHGPGLLPYRTAAECIDWSLPCPSIFERVRPLAENTLRRIAEGIRRYVLEAAEPFIVTYYGPKGDDFRGQGMGEPLKTQTAENRHALVTPFVSKINTGATGQPLTGPLHTITAGGQPQRPGTGGTMALVAPFMAPLTHHGDNRFYDLREPTKTITAAHRSETAMVAPTLIQTGYGERPGQAPRVPGLDKPLGTVVAGGCKHALVSAYLMTNTSGHAPQSPDAPMATLTTGNHQYLAAAFLAKHFGQSVGQDTSSPLHTLTGHAKHSLVTSHLCKLRGTCRHGQDERGPMATVTAGGNHLAEVRAFLIKYYGQGCGQALRDPAATVTSKDRLGLVTVMIGGEPYAIADIGLRMLQPHELFKAQGFPETYVIDRGPDGQRLTKTAQVRLCGNSVCPPVAAALVQANCGHAMAEAA